MSRMHIADQELERGRNNDSSSSPESSPRQAKKRSFSPTSDDDDLVVPPIADDDTPPPPERPIIRQAVAFAWSGSGTAVAAPAPNTYEMVIPPTIGLNKETLYLPGQEVYLPKPTRRGKKPTDGPSRKKKKTNDYGGQTTRFRINTNISATHSEPTISQSPTSTFRSLSETPTISNSSPAPAPLSGHIQEGRSSSLSEGTFISARKSPTPMQPMPSVSRWKVTDPNPVPGSSKPVIAKRPSSTKRKSHSTEGTMIERNSPHYRRDYDKNLTFQEREASHSSTTSHSIGQASGVGQSFLPTNNRHYDGGVKEGRRTQRTPLLMLTLLIQDIRSGVIDHQLAEVKVPMKAANNPKDGFWADAKILGQQLQSSASRIDGPAKVYTLRGKYRQFFLRVSADNKDEFISTHLAIKEDRMLDVVVEELLPPGQLPQPPKIPRDLIQSPSPESTSGSPSPEREIVQHAAQGDRNYDYMFRELEKDGQRQESLRRSPSVDINHRDGKPRKGRERQKRSPERRSRSRSAGSASLPSDTRFESPDHRSSPEDVHRLVSDAVDKIIQDDEGWTAFFRAQAAVEPHRAMDVLEQYHIVKRMLDTFVGKEIPFRSFKAKIEPKHITHSLKIEDPNFASTCVETLRLLDLYGENGQHYSDPRVVTMVNDKSDPPYNAKPIKRLLHLMRDIDKKWREEHPATEASSHGKSP